MSSQKRGARAANEPPPQQQRRAGQSVRVGRLDVPLDEVALYVNWNYNQLTALPTEIGGLQALTTLDVSQNQLTALPTEIGRLQALTILDMTYNRLTALPMEIGRLQALTSLYVSGNQLTALPTEIGGLQALTSLHVSCNRLTALPTAIGTLQALTSLYVSGNQLTALPTEIGGLQALTMLDVSYNQLTALPTAIGTLQALTSLYVSCNRLTALPTEIGGLQALTMLYVSYNQLTALPMEIGTLQALTSLHVRGNQLTALPTEIGGLQALTMLDVSYNRLTALPTEIGTLQALRHLMVGNNPLQLPPLDTARRGVEAIRRYLRELVKGAAISRASKLVLVGGEGGGGDGGGGDGGGAISVRHDAPAQNTVKQEAPAHPDAGTTLPTEEVRVKQEKRLREQEEDIEAGSQQRIRVKKEAAAQHAREAADGLVVTERIDLTGETPLPRHMPQEWESMSAAEKQAWIFDWHHMQSNHGMRMCPKCFASQAVKYIQKQMRNGRSQFTCNSIACHACFEEYCLNCGESKGGGRGSGYHRECGRQPSWLRALESVMHLQEDDPRVKQPPPLLKRS